MKSYINNYMVFFITILILTLTGCGGGSNQQQGAASKVVSTTVESLAAENTATVKTSMLAAAGNVNDGLVAFYPFNGNAADESGNGNTGIVAGAIQVAGKVGTGYLFNGAGDNIAVNSSPSIKLTSAATVSFWVNANNVSQDNTGIISKRGPVNEYQIYYYQGKMIGLFWGLSNVVVSSSDPSAGTWEMWTATYDGSMLKLYKNGILDASVAATGNIASAEGELWLGSDHYGHYLNGVLDEVRIYNRALTDAEIQGIYDGLVAYYPFNGNSDDESGNGNTGIVVGATQVAGKVGTGYLFNGSSDKIAVSSSPSVKLTSAATISFWINANDTIQTGIVSKRGPVNEYLVYYEQGKVSVLFWGLSNIFLAANSNPVTGSWEMWTATYDGYEIRIYRNGILDASAASSGNIDSADGELLLGSDLYGTHFNGVLDEVRIYNRALSAAEVQGIYNASNQYLVTFTAGAGGSISGTTSQTVSSGGSTDPVTAVPAAGYYFVDWTGTGGFVTTAANPLTVFNVTANQAITANFAPTPATQVSNLASVIDVLDLPVGTTDSLGAKLDSAIAGLEAGNTKAACNALGAFINETKAQSGKKISTAEANQMIDAALGIKASAGCP